MILWPLIRFFDPRFEGVVQRIDVQSAQLSGQLSGQLTAEVRGTGQRLSSDLQAGFQDLHELLVSDMQAASEGTTLLGSALAELSAMLEGLGGSSAPRSLKDESRPPIVEWPFAAAKDGARVENVTSAIVSLPYVIRALAGLQTGAKVLHVGGADGPLPLALAAVELDVTVVDPRSYPVAHPRLRAVAGKIEDWKPDETFDALVCPDADEMKIRSMLSLSSPSGLLVVGLAGVDPTRADELVEGWTIDDVTVAARGDDSSWTIAGNGSPENGELVLLTARRDH
jgi:hypothetical protein